MIFPDVPVTLWDLGLMSKQELFVFPLEILSSRDYNQAEKVAEQWN